MWIAGGANWFFGRPPEHWNPWVQLLGAGLGAYVPRLVVDLRVQANVIVEPVGIRNLTQDFVVMSA
jgi:hypothetical protein